MGVIKTAKALHATNKLPAIIFCMSRAKCVEGAHALAGTNLIHGTKLRPAPDKDIDPAGYEAWKKASDAKAAAMRAMNRAMDAMHRQHLQRFMPELGELEAYRDIWGLLQKGVAYHHGGMLPILREFVELCFQQKLIKLVFATETLAVGVNMPARTVAFTQLDKPDDTGA